MNSRCIMTMLALCAIARWSTAATITVAFQEGVSGYAGTLDTYVHEDEPSTTHGTNAKVYSDGDDDLGGILGAESQAQEVQGLIRFNNMFLSGGGASRIGGPIPDGATIVSAFLKLRTGSASGDISASEFRFHRMIATWDESTTWNSMTTGIARDNAEAATTATAVVSGGNVNVAGGLVTVDVTADLQLWSSNNTLSTRGWLIHPDSVALGGNPITGQTDGWLIDSSEAATVANRPLLEVTYELIPEPSGVLLAGFGVLGLGLAARRRRCGL